HVTRPPNTYLLLISYRSPDPGLASDVANGVAESYLEHTYNIRIRSSASLSTFMEKQLEELKAKMERSSMALNQFERELNVISPEEKTNILSARLLQLNQEHTNAQTDRVRKETAWNSAKTGSLEAAQVSTQGDALKRLTERLNEVQQKFAETKAHYGANHPEFRKAAAQLAEVERQVRSSRDNIALRVEIEYKDAAQREAMLKTAVTETKAEFDRLNAHSFEYQSLKREADADKHLYEELIRKIKEAGINAGFQNSGIRVADYARPALNPVFPNVRLNALLALIVSLLLAMGLAIVTDLLDNTIRDPEQVARTLSTTVIGTLPVVKGWRNRIGPPAHGPAGSALMRAGESKDIAISSYGEAIRTLRNSILLANMDRRVRSLLVTSASPGEGKSTTAANLAVAHAEQGKKTLIIDGDLRRPSVHRRFGLNGAQGLSNVLLGELPWRSALIPLDGLPELHILPAGPPSRRASDLVGRGLTELLEEAAAEYDLVILDAPPLLGFAEPLQMATAVDGVLVVTRAGETNRKAVGSVLRTLSRLRAHVVGVALNEVNKDISNNYYYYGQYGKYQKYYQTKEA
ncbi:MAG: polysaccharide biosynthesis tyrosine autokinase, partial [Bryobacteraceae bacterium]